MKEILRFLMIPLVWWWPKNKDWSWFTNALKIQYGLVAREVVLVQEGSGSNPHSALKLSFHSLKVHLSSIMLMVSSYITHITIAVVRLKCWGRNKLCILTWLPWEEGDIEIQWCPSPVTTTFTTANIYWYILMTGEKKPGNGSFKTIFPLI